MPELSFGHGGQVGKEGQTFVLGFPLRLRRGGMHQQLDAPLLAAVFNDCHVLQLEIDWWLEDSQSAMGLR